MRSQFRCIVAAAAIFAMQSVAFSEQPSSDEAQIRAALHSIEAAIKRGDPQGAMQPYTDDCLVFDLSPPRAIIGKAHNVDSYKAFFAGTNGPVTAEYSDINIKVYPGGAVAYGDYTVRMVANMKDGTKLDMLLRMTDVFEKHAGKWLIAHEHASLPVNLRTGVAVARAPRTLQEGASEDFWSNQKQWP